MAGAPRLRRPRGGMCIGWWEYEYSDDREPDDAASALADPASRRLHLAAAGPSGAAQRTRRQPGPGAARRARGGPRATHAAGQHRSESVQRRRGPDDPGSGTGRGRRVALRLLRDHHHPARSGDRRDRRTGGRRRGTTGGRRGPADRGARRTYALDRAAGSGSHRGRLAAARPGGPGRGHGTRAHRPVDFQPGSTRGRPGEPAGR